MPSILESHVTLNGALFFALIMLSSYKIATIGSQLDSLAHLPVAGIGLYITLECEN